MSIALLADYRFPFPIFGPLGLIVMLILWLLANLAVLHGLRCLVSWLWSSRLTLED